VFTIFGLLCEKSDEDGSLSNFHDFYALPTLAHKQNFVMDFPTSTCPAKREGYMQNFKVGKQQKK
jgi:hypothetical protein